MAAAAVCVVSLTEIETVVISFIHIKRLKKAGSEVLF